MTVFFIFSTQSGGEYIYIAICTRETNGQAGCTGQDETDFKNRLKTSKADRKSGGNKNLAFFLKTRYGQKS